MSQEQGEELAPIRTLRLQNKTPSESCPSINITRSRGSISHLADDFASGQGSIRPSTSTPARRLFLKRESLLSGNPFLNLNALHENSRSNSHSRNNSPRRQSMIHDNLDSNPFFGDRPKELTDFGDIQRRSSMLHMPPQVQPRSRFRVRSSIFGDFGPKKRNLSDFLGHVEEDIEDDNWMAREVLEPKKKILEVDSGKNSQGKGQKKRDSLNSKKSNKKGYFS